MKHYERRHQPLLPRRDFAVRVFRHGAFSGVLIVLALAVGVIGYRVTAGLNTIDALENATMILTGMGPVSPMPTTAAKLFASAYALFSGVVFVTAMGVVVAPTLHRLFHHFHIESDEH